MSPPLLALLSGAVRLLPPALDAPLAGALGRMWCALEGRKRRAARANRAALAEEGGTGADLRPLTPEAAPFCAYVVSLLGWLRLLRLDRRGVVARSTVEGLAPLAEAAANRHGTILVAAHVGEWEWGAAALAARGLRVVAVADLQLRAGWTPALRRAKARLGIEVVSPAVSAARLVRALREGAVVALLVDGDLATSRRSARVGAQSVLLPLGPARLAARFGARLVAGRCDRDLARAPGHYSVRLTPLDRGAEEAPELEARTALLHDAVARWLTSTLREDPGAWCIFRPFFDVADELAPVARPARPAVA